jgi:hypothetical protein
VYIIPGEGSGCSLEPVADGDDPDHGGPACFHNFDDLSYALSRGENVFEHHDTITSLDPPFQTLSTPVFFGLFADEKTLATLTTLMVRQQNRGGHRDGSDFHAAESLTVQVRTGGIKAFS